MRFPGVLASKVFAVTVWKWILLGVACVLTVPVIVHEASRLQYRQLFGDFHKNVKTSEKVVALTFDDGPHPVYTRQVLEVLDRHRVKATFFMVGTAIEEHPEIAKLVYANGHELGNHSYSHARLVFKSPGFVRSEIDRTDSLLRNVGVMGAIHFRSPFSSQLIILPYVLWQKKKKNILFDVVPRDWETKDPQLLTRRVLEQTDTGSIILLHDGGGDRSGTVKALEMIIRELKERGFQFVKVSELLTYAEK